MNTDIETKTLPKYKVGDWVWYSNLNYGNINIIFAKISKVQSREIYNLILHEYYLEGSANCHSENNLFLTKKEAARFVLSYCLGNKDDLEEEFRCAQNNLNMVNNNIERMQAIISEDSDIIVKFV